MAINLATRFLNCCGLGIVLALLLAATSNAQDTSVVIASVGKEHLTIAASQRIVDFRQSFESNPGADSALRGEIIEDWIFDRLIEHEARTMSLKDHHGPLARVRKAVLNRAAQLFASDNVMSMIKIDSATVDTFYHNHIARYTADRDQRRARVITVWKEGREPAKGMMDVRDSLYRGWYPEDVIDSLYTRLADGEKFGTLAARFSEDPLTKGLGGDLGWITSASAGSGPFADRAMTQPVGMISKPFESGEGWHIVQVVAERKAGPVPLDYEIGADIMKHLVEEQHKAIIRKIGDSLLAVARLDFEERYLDTRHDQLRDAMPLLVVNGRDTMFAAEFLMDQYKWTDSQTREKPTPQRREELLQNEYGRILSWMKFLRERGYFDHPDIVTEQNARLQSEREALVALRLDEGATDYVPDSTAIRGYFEKNKAVYGDAAGALESAWNSIRSKLISEHRESLRQAARQRLEDRWKVVRHTDRYRLVPLLTHRPKKDDA